MKNNTLLTRVISIILITALLGSNIVWARPRAAGNVREDCLSAESQFHKLNFAEKLRKVRNILRSSEKTDMLKRFIQFDGSFLPEDAGATKKSARPEAKSIPLVKQLVPWYRELAFVRGAVDIDESRQYQDKLLVWNNESSLPEELNIIREDELTPAQAEECAQLIDKLGGEKYFVFSGGVRPVGYLLVEKSIFGEVTITVRDRSEGRYSGVECEILAFAYNKYFIDEDCRRIFINDPSEG